VHAYWQKINRVRDLPEFGAISRSTALGRNPRACGFPSLPTI
jgi:hypothetical protein